eukprot:364304-Chlamydomonas_euryale.AAC.1
MLPFGALLPGARTPPPPPVLKLGGWPPPLSSSGVGLPRSQARGLASYPPLVAHCGKLLLSGLRST